MLNFVWRNISSLETDEFDERLSRVLSPEVIRKARGRGWWIWRSRLVILAVLAFLCALGVANHLFDSQNANELMHDSALRHL